MRAAFIAANMIGSQSQKEITDADFMKMVEHLSAYLVCDKDRDPNEEDIDREALNRMKETT